MYVPLAEDELTRVRSERKVLLTRDEADAFAVRLARAAPPQESRVVAVYFDGEDRRLARRAAVFPRACVKIRAKAYEPDRGSPRGRVVLEVKRERGDTISKERVWLAPSGLRDAVERGLAGTFGLLAPVVATSYRRRVFQTGPWWRVTMDDELRFHPADWSLFEGDAPTWRGALAPSFAAEPNVVVELKYGPGPLPRWLDALGRARGVAYSKFGAACAHAARRSGAGA